jgi:hypothetical protein
MSDELEIVLLSRTGISMLPLDFDRGIMEKLAGSERV